MALRKKETAMEIYINDTEPRHADDWRWAKEHAVWRLVAAFGTYYECVSFVHDNSNYSASMSLAIGEYLVLLDIPRVSVGGSKEAKWIFDTCVECGRNFYWRGIEGVPSLCSCECTGKWFEP